MFPRPFVIRFPLAFRFGLPALCCLALCAGLIGCGPAVVVRKMEVTAYCGCGQCCQWERGSWKYLKLNFWNKYISSGKNKGRPYSGLTASGTKPHQPRPGLFSADTFCRPWVLPFRLVIPWLWCARDGTIAADTVYYPFGTRMFVEGYGYGIVEDRGGAIKGPRRIDLFYDSHKRALRWGRRQMEVKVFR